MPGDPRLLQPAVSELTRLDQGRLALLYNADVGLSMRLANGDRLRSLELNWRDASLREGSRFEISVAREFDLVDAALEVLLRNHREASGDGLQAGPFRRAALIAELDQALSSPLLAGPWGGAVTGSASAERPAPAVAVASLPAKTGEAGRQSDGALELLQPLCGHCHAAESRNPPGFLAGSDSRGRIEQCAPRILARLRAWRDSSDSAVAPMPPPATIGPGWAEGEHYRKLVAAVENLLSGSRHSAARIGAEAAENELLPPCLASG